MHERNPLSAGLKILPIHYEWSSASLYFRSPAQTDFRNLRTVGTLSYREKRSLLHSQTNELDTYTITPEGMISPESYVAVQAAEELFYTPARLMYFISSYTDDELIISIGNICQEVFRCESPDKLSIEDRYRLADLVRKRYGTPFKQIARLTGTDPEILRRAR